MSVAEVAVPRTFKIGACKRCQEPVLTFDGVTVTTRTMRKREDGSSVARVHVCAGTRAPTEEGPKP